MKDILQLIRKQSPLVHNMTNYVTVKDCANALLAIGASPIMADEEREVEDIVSIASALVINIGTLNERVVTSMLKAGKKANALGVPVVFDPVGAGASAYRSAVAKKFLAELNFAVIRGNVSEIGYLAGEDAKTKGVDVAEEDEERDGFAIAKRLQEKTGAVVAVTGAVDVVVGEEKFARIANGSPMQKSITGAGCMASALTGAFVAVEDPYVAAVDALLLSGIAGQMAEEAAKDKGSGSFRIAYMDALSMMTDKNIEEWRKIDECRL